MHPTSPSPILLAASCAALAIAPVPLPAQGGFDFTGDTNGGIPVSMFGTYIRPGEVLVYPFFEYYYDADAEYSPDEFGFGLDRDFRADARGSEYLLFVGYGVSDRLAVEAEAALYTDQWQDKAAGDPTAMPSRIQESGLGDVEGQIRYRWTGTGTEEGGAALFSYLEAVLPLQRDKVLIGTSDWEFKLGTGILRGFSWGTMTFRLAAEYDGEEDAVALGEYAVEYLRRVSDSVRLFAAVEGSEDEVEFIPVVLLNLGRRVALHLNSAFALTSKATDWAPEVGVMISLP